MNRLEQTVSRQVDQAALKNQFPQKVVVMDINMSFPSMVWFMVKWALAAIPAMIIVGGSAFILWAIFMGLMMGV